MTPQKSKKVIHEKKEETLKAGRGGARAGAGRKSGSGAFGEATVPMRVPVSLADELGAILDHFKEKAVEKKESTQKIAPLYAKALKDKANVLIELAGKLPSGKPIDIIRVLTNHPESCYAWHAQSDYKEWDIKLGDTVIIDRSIKAKNGCLAAFWKGESVELMRVDIKETGTTTSKSVLEVSEIQEKALENVQVWGVVVGITRKMNVRAFKTSIAQMHKA